MIAGAFIALMPQSCSSQLPPEKNVAEKPALSIAERRLGLRAEGLLNNDKYSSVSSILLSLDALQKTLIYYSYNCSYRTSAAAQKEKEEKEA